MIKRVSIAVLLASMILFACGAKGNKEETAETSLESPTADYDTSYAFGMILGSDLKQLPIQYDYDAFMQGFKDMLEDKETRLSQDDAMAKVETEIRNAYMTAMTEMAEENRKAETVFLEENRNKPGITTTSSGLQYEVVSQGSGPKPGAGDVVLVHYEGTLLDGTPFDSSYSRGEPAEFSLEGVIPGWTEGIQLMNTGSTYRFYVPSYLAYGEQGAGNFIQPNATLIFVVELLSIIN